MHLTSPRPPKTTLLMDDPISNRLVGVDFIKITVLIMSGFISSKGSKKLFPKSVYIMGCTLEKEKFGFYYRT